MAITFDTLKFMQTLEEAGVERKQAVAFAAAVRDTHDTADVATKGDLLQLRTEIKGEIALVRKDMDFMRWLLGLVLGGVVAILVRSFF